MKKGLLGLIALVFMVPVSNAATDEVNIYSYRQPFLIDPITNKFTEKTGIKVNIIYAKKGIAEKLEREGKYSPADLILTSDFNRLVEVTSKGLTQKVASDALTANIPAQYRGSDNQWFALTTRARVIYASKDRIENAKTLSYEDLASEKFKGKICVRSGKHPYNISLIASMIAHNGEAETKQWLVKVKDNLARKPQGNDRAQVKAIKEGVCDVSLGNSYYFGKMLVDEAQKPWADAVNIIFPNQANRGAHINISGVAMAKYAPNKDNARALMEFLSGEEAQSLYASLNMEYPVNAKIEPSEMVKSWGEFKADVIPLSTVIKHQQAAYNLLDEVKFDL
ncbi:MAG: iron ABC transporter substrate-binding protein [Gammaproteobacteria bacterium]|nr:MAG: iron ABC transporter substrate-binding protein [Gammaproteobacteria bacterium]